MQTAGLTLAARLTEDPTRSVLVLETGGGNIDDPDISTCCLPSFHRLDALDATTYQCALHLSGTISPTTLIPGVTRLSVA